MEGYNSKVVHTFKAGGQRWTVLNSSPNWVEIEEIEKNGQEDTHLGGGEYQV